MIGVLTQQARELGTASYDREVCTENLIEQMRAWRFTKRYDDSRMLAVVRATFDVLDAMVGDTLAERWIRFEDQVWPRWQSGQDRRLSRFSWKLRWRSPA